MSIIQTPWTQQPQQSVGIDWSRHKPYVAALPGRSFFNLADGRSGSVIGAAATGNAVQVGKSGLLLQFHPSGGANGYAGLRFPSSPFDASTDATIIWCGIPDNLGSGGVNGELVTRGADGAGGWDLQLSYVNNTTLVAQCVDTSPAGYSASLTPSGLSVGVEQRVALRKRGTSISVFDWKTKTSNTASAGNGGLRSSTIGVGLAAASGSSASAPGHNRCNTLLVFPSGLTDGEVWSLLDNPWQIFRPIQRRIFVPVAAATGDATGTGSFAAISLGAVTGSASAGTSATATGSFASSSLSAPSASATGSALGTGSFAAISLGAVTGSASAGTSATATGSFAASSLSAPSASATGSALATGTLTAVSLSSVTGSATGTTAGNAEGVGSVATIALTAPSASASASALATGTFSALSLSAPTGTASNATNATATGGIQAISISAPLAIAIGSAVATGGIQSIGLTAPVGHATGETPLTDSEKIDLILDILSNRQTLDPTTGIYTLYDDTGAVVLKTALAWEDVGRTIPYRGQGLSVLDALE